MTLGLKTKKNHNCPTGACRSLRGWKRSFAISVEQPLICSGVNTGLSGRRKATSIVFITHSVLQTSVAVSLHCFTHIATLIVFFFLLWWRFVPVAAAANGFIFTPSHVSFKHCKNCLECPPPSPTPTDRPEGKKLNWPWRRAVVFFYTPSRLEWITLKAARVNERQIEIRSVNWCLSLQSAPLTTLGKRNHSQREAGSTVCCRPQPLVLLFFTPVVQPQYSFLLPFKHIYSVKIRAGMKMIFLLLSLLLFPALEATQLVKAQACWDSLLNSLGGKMIRVSSC